jgi:hypothetical protein
MTVDLASVIWSEVKSFIPSIDRQEAAEIVVSVLVDHDVDIEDIRQEFKGDSDIKKALAQYVKDHEEDEDDEDDDDYYDDEDEDDDY